MSRLAELQVLKKRIEAEIEAEETRLRRVRVASSHLSPVEQLGYPRTPITHGTDTGYSRHRKAGEDACEPCKEAHRLMEQVRYRRRKEAS